MSPTLKFAYLPTVPVFTGVSKFFIKSPGLEVGAPYLPENYLPWLFLICFFINLVISDISKRKIKQEGDLLLLFELLDVDYRCRFNEYPNCQKPTNQIAKYIVESWRGFRVLSTSVEAKMAIMHFGSLQ